MYDTTSKDYPRKSHQKKLFMPRWAEAWHSAACCTQLAKAMNICLQSAVGADLSVGAASVCDNVGIIAYKVFCPDDVSQAAI